MDFLCSLSVVWHGVVTFHMAHYPVLRLKSRGGSERVDPVMKRLLCVFLLLLVHSQLNIGGSLYWPDFCICSYIASCWVATFCLQVWYLMGVFLWLAFTCQGHIHQNLNCVVWWKACIHRLDLVLFSPLKDLWIVTVAGVK